MLRNPKGRAWAVAVLSLAVLSAAYAAPSNGVGSEGDAKSELRMQLFPSNLVSFYPQLADKHGIFSKHKLDVSLIAVRTAPQALAAMLAGSLDLAPNTPDGYVLAKAKGIDVIAVAANTQQPVFQILASSKYVDAGGALKTKVAAMVGHSVAVYGRGGTSDRFVNFLFKTNQIPSEPEFVIAGAAKTVAAFLAGKVDFASDTVQIADLLEAAGKGGTYINCAVDKCAPGSGGDKQLYWTTAKFANEHAETVKRFVAAMDDTNQWVHDPANKNAVIKYLKQFYPAPSGIDADKYASLLYTSQLDLINSTALNPADIETSMNRLLELGQLKKPIDVKSLVWSGASIK